MPTRGTTRRVVQRDPHHGLVAEHEAGRIEFEGLPDVDVADLDIAAELSEHFQAFVDGRRMTDNLDHNVCALAIGQRAHGFHPVLLGGQLIDVDDRIGAEGRREFESLPEYRRSR